jgi:signal transduction histidine kinase
VVAFQKERFELAPFLEELTSIQQRRFNMPISFRAPESLAVTTDRMALTTVLNNLIENAWKYGQTEQGLDITASCNDRFLQLRVRDYGKGIALAEQHSIFRKFVRLENEETRSAKGTGLGLYIAHEFTRALGGQLRLVQPDGPGACFEIQIPYE